MLQNEILQQWNLKNLAIFQDLPGIQNNRYNPVIRLKFFNTSYVKYINSKSPKFFLRFLRSKLLAPSLLVILLRWPTVTIFENFLEKRKIFQQKNYSTFIYSL